MSATNFSAGLGDEKELVVATEPTEPFWSENLLFAGHDPTADVCMWLHLGTVPNDWTMWEDRVILRLPGEEGLLSMRAYYRTQPDKRPAGANLSFTCIEPFRRWHVTFDGFAQHISIADMTAGLAPDSPYKRLVIDLDVTCVSPVWDAQASAADSTGKGGMSHQSWAKEHYEQMWRATGTVTAGDRPIRFDGSGWRDHSRGPRGGETADPWGGHVIAGCLFPSGRSLIFSRYWRPDGAINLEGALIGEANGGSVLAQVVEAPRLTDLIAEGEDLPVVLRAPDSEVRAVLRTRRSMWTSMQKQLAIGKDLSGRGLMYVLNFGEVEWDGEIGQFYIERSDPLNDRPAMLHAPQDRSLASA